MTAPAHVLELVHRGAEHRHRWQARCSCGWVAVPLRLKRSALEGWRGHARIRRKARNAARPRPVTPVDQLPAELRPREETPVGR